MRKIWREIDTFFTVLEMEGTTRGLYVRLPGILVSSNTKPVIFFRRSTGKYNRFP